MGKRLIVGLSVVLAGLIVVYLGVRPRRASRLVPAMTEAAEPGVVGRSFGAVERDRFARRDFPRGVPAASAAAVAMPVPSVAAPDSGVGPDQARDERDAQIQALRASGAEDGHLSDAVRTLARHWESMIPGGVTNATVGSWACFQAGCFVTVHHRSEESIGPLGSRILGSSEWQNWTGMTMRSAPIRLLDGSTEVTWFVFSPRDAAVD